MNLTTADIQQMPDSPARRALMQQLGMQDKKSRAARHTGAFAKRKAKRLAKMIDELDEHDDGWLLLDVAVQCGNPLNARSPGSWRKHSEDRKAIRAWVLIIMKTKTLPALPVTIQLTRVGPRTLDAWDGLPASLKPVVDAVADAYGLKDDDARLCWLTPMQEKGNYGVRIKIQSKGAI